MNNNKGVSLLSLSIIIIVMIILASIVIINGGDAPGKAENAKFMSQAADYKDAIKTAYAQIYEENIYSEYPLHDDEIYGMIANPGSAYPTPLGVRAVIPASINLIGGQLFSDTCFEISDDASIAGWDTNINLTGEPNEKHYVCDDGTFFVYPGYECEVNGETRFYINEFIYYTE